MKDVMDNIFKYMKEKQTGESTGHDWWHSLRVYNMALHLSEHYKSEIDINTVKYASILHDIEDWKLNDGNESVGPDAAGVLLAENHVDNATINHVKKIIRELSYKGSVEKSSMSTLEGEIVQDADRLDAVGAIGIARTFAFGGAFGNEIFNPEIKPIISISKDEYMDRKRKSTTVNHFFEKLFFLKDLYNTSQAKKIGEERHEYIVEYISKLLEDLDATDTVHYRLLKNNQSIQGDCI